jgi:hypothetical protein
MCAYDKPFALPDHLLEKIKAGNVVVFAGAGISTENKNHCTSTFYEEVQADLKLKDGLGFPELMTKFCELPDGRIKLLEKIKRRIDYFKSFDDFYRPMTRFHRAISPLFMITDIITTNWDDFFERECDFDAFIYDGDLAFWDASRRRVMKIHGSITNLGSVVATSEDYKQSFKRLNDGALGAHLKSLIARKTVLYVGYSLSDENYLRLLRNISTMMDGHIRQSYFVAPYVDKAKLSKTPIPLVPIETDGAFFFEEIRKTVSQEAKIVRDDAFLDCIGLLSEAAEKHDRTADAFLKTHHPLLVFALSYQDGLIHALQRILKMRKSGEYHSIEAVHGRVHAYEHKIDEFLAKKDFWNAAYGIGYQNGLIFLLVRSADEKSAQPPLFELPFASKAKSLSAVLKLSKSNLPKDAAAQARKILTEDLKLAGLIPDHTPYL